MGLDTYYTAIIGFEIKNDNRKLIYEDLAKKNIYMKDDEEGMLINYINGIPVDTEKYKNLYYFVGFESDGPSKLFICIGQATELNDLNDTYVYKMPSSEDLISANQFITDLKLKECVVNMMVTINTL